MIDIFREHFWACWFLILCAMYWIAVLIEAWINRKVHIEVASAAVRAQMNDAAPK
jgi:hypothetical protein